MTGSDKVRHAFAAGLLTATIIALIVNPVPLKALVTFAVVGVVSGSLLALPTTITAWVGGAILLFGIEWTQSVLIRGGAGFPWYSPVLIAASLAVVTYYVVRFTILRNAPVRT
jgi:hypothetical protein